MTVTPQELDSTSDALLAEVDKLLNAHPIRDALTAWLSPNAYDAFEAAARRTVHLQAPRAPWPPIEYHLVPDPNGGKPAHVQS
ncbi:hypothetical protein [Streptomyces sp. NPDC004296]|uniref:hypothetical protein n=1 Tax=Streptomyces sp. NPDC004296 TaxID=3364697 RepID=UPI003684C5C0